MMRRIQCKYTEQLFAPANALEEGIRGNYLTMDGVECYAEPNSTWNNDDGEYDERFDELCDKLYGCPFSTIRSIWIARLGHVDQFWHLVRLVKND